MGGEHPGVIGAQERPGDRAYRTLRDEIVALDLLPGAPLDERALSVRLGVGVTPVRDALKRLVSVRLAVRHPGRGIYVSGIEIADQAHLTEVRIELEGLAAALAAERSGPEQHAELRRLLAELEADPQDRSRHTALDGAVHRALYAASQNPFLEATLGQYADLALRIWNLGLRELDVDPEHIRSQREVVEAVCRGDADAARRAAEHHLRAFSHAFRGVIGS